MKSKRWLLWIVLGGLMLRIAVWWFFRYHETALVVYRLPDDALYYFGMARNMAHGFGISFDSVHPSNGMHPLWLFFITPIFLRSVSKWALIHDVFFVQSVLDALIIWLVGKTVYDLLPNAKPSNRITAAAIPAAMYAASSIVILRGINGMETTLAALLIILWFRTFLWANNGTTLRWILLGIVTGLLFLARTDSFLVLFPLALYEGWMRGKSQWKPMLAALIFAFIIILPWLLWNWITFGTIIQSSAEAVPMLAMRKYAVMYGSSMYFHLALEAIRNAFKPFWYAAFGIPILTMGYAMVLRRKNISPAERGIYFLILGGILLLVFHTIVRGFIRDWYVVELLPLFLIAFGISMGSNAGADERLSTEARASGRWTLAALIIVVQGVFYIRPQFPSQSQILYSGLFTSNLMTSHHLKVASFNSGFYGYFSDHPENVVNVDGVVNMDALRALKAGNLRAYLLSDSVNYIMDFAGDFGGYVNLFDRHLLNDSPLDSTFQKWGRGLNPIVVYKIGQKEMPKPD